MESMTLGREPIRFLRHPLGVLASGLARVPAFKAGVAYGLSVAAVGVATAARFGLGVLVGESLPPFITFYPLIMFTALFAGTGPGLLATVLAELSVAYFFLPPVGIGVGQAADETALALFFVINVAVSVVCGALRSARFKVLAQARRAAASEERFRLFMGHTPALAWLKDEAGHYVYVNKAYEERFGISLSDCVGKTDAQLWSAAVAARLRQADQETLAAGHPIEVTEETTEEDGSRTFWLSTKFAFRDAAGRQFIASIGLDVTPAKRAEEALREQAQLEHLRADATQMLQRPAAMEELLQGVAALLVERLDAAFARVWTLDKAGQTLELQASAGLYTHLDGGHARVSVGKFKIGRIAQRREPLVSNQVIGDPHVPEQDWAKREGLVAFAGFPLIAEGRLLGVVALFARHKLSAATVETFSAVAGILAQSLARQQAEALLQRRNEHLQILHQAAARLLLKEEPVGLLADLHPQIAQTFGADVFLMYQIDEGNSHLHLQGCAGLSEEERRKVEVLRFGCVLCARPEEALRPIVATHIQTVDAPNRRFARKLGFRSYLHYPLIINNRVQGTLALASRQRDDYEASDLEFFQTFAGTVAEALERQRLKAEVERHTAHLETLVQERTAKLQETISELELFSYTISHDMRAPLRTMTGFAEVLVSAYADALPDKGRELLRRISEGAVRMDHLITDALQYTQIVRSEIRLTRVDPSGIVRSIVEGYPEFQPPKAEIEFEPHMPPVLANEAALTQVFSNLLGNAVKFVAPGVMPRIRVWAERPGAPMLELQDRRGKGSRMAKGPGVRIWVEDNGIGIAPEHHEKIWQMFHQLNQTYDGTGIGLALVQKAVQRMNGRAGVESEPGKGSRFWIELPCGAGAPPAPTMSTALRQPPTQP